jgi:gluconolactonase
MARIMLDIQDERLLNIVSPDSELEIVVAGFKFTEGPIWHPYEQHLVFSDITGNSIFRWSERDGLHDICPNSHLANGNMYDGQGRRLTCHHASSRVTRTEADGSVTVIASHYEGKQLNSPNDIIVKRDGSIYFTDPMSGREPRVGIPREPELPFSGVYRVNPDTLDLMLLVDDFRKPNGLCFSLDESRLFVNDTIRFHIRVFDVRDDGTLANGRVWAEIRGNEVGVPDGMKIDSERHLFTCGPGGVHVFSEDATCLGRLLVPEQTTNFIWGDDDLRSLYITTVSTVYRVHLNIPGLPLC